MGRDLFDESFDDLEDDDYLDGLDDEEQELSSDDELGIDYHEIRPKEESQSFGQHHPEDNALVSPEAEVYSPMMSGSGPVHRDLTQSTIAFQSHAERKHARNIARKAAHKTAHKLAVKLAHKLATSEHKLSRRAARKIQKHVNKLKSNKHKKHALV